MLTTDPRDTAETTVRGLEERLDAVEREIEQKQAERRELLVQLTHWRDLVAKLTGRQPKKELRGATEAAVDLLRRFLQARSEPASVQEMIDHLAAMGGKFDRNRVYYLLRLGPFVKASRGRWRALPAGSAASNRN